MSLDLEDVRELLENPQLSNEELISFCVALRAMVSNIFDEMSTDKDDF